MKLNDAPAFPIKGALAEHQFSGLSKREVFAGLAMQGLCSNREFQRSMDRYITEAKVDLKLHQGVAIAAVEYADALINELEKQEE